MNLEDQVVSLELSKKLKGLGVNKDSLWSWYTKGTQKAVSGGDETIHLKIEGYKLSCPAYTAAEMGEILPKELGGDYGGVFITTVTNNYGWDCDYYSFFRDKSASQLEKADTFQFMSNTEADARAKMLIYLLENEIVKL